MPPPTRLRQLPLIPALVTLILLAQALGVIRRPYEVNHDTATLLHVAELLLEGRLPYVSIFETNPPMSWYLHLVPVAIARFLDANVIVVTKLGVLLLTALVAWSVRPLTSRARDPLRTWESGALSLGVAASPWVMSTYMFGQREHLFALVLVPWFLVRWLRHHDGTVPGGVASLVGVFAGIAGCMKPPLFLPLLFIPDLYWWSVARRVQHLCAAEIIAAAATTLLFALHLFAFPGDVWRTFFFRYLPLLAGGYASYNLPMSEVWRAAGRLLTAPVLLAVVFLALPLRGQTRLRSLVRPLGLLILGSAAVFLLQHKGWSYHSVPARLWALLLAALGSAMIGGLLRDRFGSWPRMLHRLRPGVAAAAWATTLPLLAYTAVVGARPEGSLPAPADHPYAQLVVRFTRPGDSVMILNSSVSPAFPMLLQLKRRAGTRYISTVPLPLLYHFSQPAPGSALGHRLDSRWLDEEQRFLEDLREDVRRYHPKLILVNAKETCGRCPEGLGIARYLRVKGFLPQALESAYSSLGLFGEFEAYVRRSGTGP